MRSTRLFVLLLAIFVVQSIAAQGPPSRTLRIIAFGAHPDDAELKFAGTAALFAAAGHKVKLVALTNGDVGHFAGGEGRWRSAARLKSRHATRSWGRDRGARHP